MSIQAGWAHGAQELDKPPSSQPSDGPCSHVDVVEVVWRREDSIPLDDDVVCKRSQRRVLATTEDAKRGPVNTDGDETHARRVGTGKVRFELQNVCGPTRVLARQGYSPNPAWA